MIENLIEIDTRDLDDRPDPAPGVMTRLRGWLRDLGGRLARASRWTRGRLDLEPAALAVSLAAHLVVLTVLGTVGLAVHETSARRFDGTVGPVDTALADMTTTTFQDLDQTADRPVSAAAGSFAPEFAAVSVSAPAPAAGASLRATGATEVGTAAALARFDVRRATEAVVPRASMYGRNVAIRGNGAEHVGSPEGAVDRIAQEILRRLESGRTLVVWAFDASGSLVAERERLAKHIETVYAHIKQLDADARAADGGLLTAVVAFGQDRQVMTAKPTADPDLVAAAIRAVPLDTTGIESTFRTVAEAVGKWGRYRDKAGNVYRAMVIVVTDEVGDDEELLEETISRAGERKVPVYVLGSQAIFARTEGRMNYTDPKTGRTYYNVAVRQGPESVMPEQVRLPFWYGGDQYDTIDSGFGPYALSRLAGATGGIYFVTRLGQARQGFDPAAMGEYRPDWVSRARYEAEVASHPVRRAVIEAALLTQQNKLPGMPSLFFPAVDDPAFKDVMMHNQELVALTNYTVNPALDLINAAAKLRDHEPSRRWQAHYDLARGRLLALKARCDEYNWACAHMKKDAPKFSKPGSNAWRLMPDAKIHYGGDKTAALARQATALLKKVVAQHPDTPWALLASRELKDPLGFQWIETHVRPVSRKETNPGSEPRKRPRPGPPPKPPEPPKL